MNQGYIKIHRKLWDNPISKKPKYLAVWLFLVSHANHKDKYTILNNEKITIKRGSFVGSIKGISKHFKSKTSSKSKISRTSVGNILKYLILDTMLDIKTTNKYTVFTILNYDDYQKMDTSLDIKRTSSGHQADTTKNEKNEKNDKNKNKEIYKEKNLEIEKLKNQIEKLKNQKKPSKSKNEKTKLELNFKLEQKTIDKLNEEGYYEEQINKNLLSFRDYWIEGDGKKQKKLNWQTTFKIWIRKSRSWNNKHNEEVL